MRLFSLLLVLALTAVSLPAAETPTPIAKTGRLLFEDTLSQPPDSGWRVAKGKWEVKDGAWTAATITEEKHGPNILHALPASDVVIEIEFRFNAAQKLHLSFNDDVGHVSRTYVEPSAIEIRKDSYQHKTDETLMRTPAGLSLATNKWHTLLLQLRGNQIYAQVGDTTSLGTHPDLAKTKTRFELGYGKGDLDGEVRNLRIYEALPLQLTE